MQEYEQRYFYIFKMTDKTGSSNRSSSKAHSRSSQPNESEVSITVILLQNKTVFGHNKLKNVFTGSNSMAIKTGSTYICDSMRDIITIPTANLLSGRVCKKYQQVTVTSMTTGNSDMTDNTGNGYTTGTTTNGVEITTASQVFLTIVNPNKCP